jgi:hypothetical protein
MSATAILCPVCKSYKSSWRTAVVYVAGIAGLIGLLGSAGAYIINQIPNIYKIIAWEDKIKIWEFTANEHVAGDFTISASNVGDGPIILSSVILYYRETASASYNINKILQPRESLVTNETPPSEGKKTGTTSLEAYKDFVANPSGKPNDTIIKHSSLDTYEAPCFLVVPYNQTSRDLKRMDDHYQYWKMHLITDELRAFVRYFSIHDGKDLLIPFPAVATFVRSTKPECQSLNY